MADPAEDEIVVAVAEGIVAETAPHELPLFAETSAAFLEEESRIGERRAEEKLAFDVPVDVAIALAPYALTVTRAVVRFLSGEVKKALRDEASGVVSAAVKRLFKRFRGDEAPPAAAPAALTREQLQQVRAVALEKARQLRVPPAKAALLADSLVGSLVVESP